MEPECVNSPAAKEKLQTILDKIKFKDDSPVTNLKLDKNLVEEIEQLTIEVEKINPNPQPLLNATSLLNGKWMLHKS